MGAADVLVCPHCGTPLPAARARQLSIVEEAEAALRAAHASVELHIAPEHPEGEGEDG